MWYDLHIITSWLEGPATSAEPVLASTGPAAARRTLDAPEQCYRSTDSRTFGHVDDRRLLLFLRTPPGNTLSRVQSPLRQFETTNGLGLRRATAGGDTRLAGFHDTDATPAVATTFLGEPISPDQHGVIAAVGLHQPSVSKSAVCPSETREVGDISPANRAQP